MSTSGGGTVQTPDDRLAVTTIRAVFFDCFVRPPLEVERQTWLGKPFEEFFLWASGTEEFWRAWLEEQLYYFLLVDTFRPATDTIQNLPALMLERRIQPREVLSRICLSSSFDRRNPGPDTFVSVVMEQILGMTVQKAARELEMGKRLYDGSAGTFLGKPGKSQSDVVAIAVAHPDANRYFVAREFGRLMRSAASDKQLTEWCDALDGGRLAFRDLLHQWFMSERYAQRLRTATPMPNRMFVRSLFVDLMQALHADSELRRVGSALDGLADPRPLRSLLARMILDSGRSRVPTHVEVTDRSDWVTRLFEQLLGRSPAPDELRVFLDSLADAECRPSTLVYALVSHPEYQKW